MGGERRRSCCTDSAHSSPETPGEDEVEASGGARSEALPLLHRCTGSSDGPTAPIQAVRGRRSRPMPPTAPAPSSRRARGPRDRTPQAAHDREPGSRSATRSRRGCRARRAVPSSSSAAGTRKPPPRSSSAKKSSRGAVLALTPPNPASGARETQHCARHAQTTWGTLALPRASRRDFGTGGRPRVVRSERAALGLHDARKHTGKRTRTDPFALG